MLKSSTGTTINYQSASELAAKIRAGEISSRQVVEGFITQIKTHNPTYNAVVTLNEQAALEQADKADQSLANGVVIGPLHGVPITIKDTYRVKGLRVTAGHLPLKQHVAEKDAVPVRLLKEAGDIIIGKTNTAELALDMQTDNPVFGRTNNPWDVGRTPSGSSGGCVAALAAGMTPLSIGSDLAGSIRVPASFCGVYGLKPTHGVISFEGHIPPIPGQINGFRTMAVPGPLTRSVDDLSLALNILSQPNRYDRKVAPLLPPQPGEIDISNLKIAWMDNFGNVPVSSEIRGKMETFVAALAEAGATVEKSEPPSIDYNEIWELWGSLVGMQSKYDTSNFMRAIGDLFARKSVAQIPMHRNIVGPISVPKLMQALETQSRTITKLDNFLSEYDAWICPASSTTAFKHHAHSRNFDEFKIYNNPLQVDGVDVPYYVATQSYTTVFTATDSPVVSMPIGLGQSDLPVNVQVVGKRYTDFRLLNIVKALEPYAEKLTYPLQERPTT